MFKAFEMAGYGKEEVEKRFGGMVNAFQYGAPPHGGCAAGIDRIVMPLADEANIREVMLFPMNQKAEDLMMGAPNEPDPAQLRELHLRLNLPAEDSFRARGQKPDRRLRSAGATRPALRALVVLDG